MSFLMTASFGRDMKADFENLTGSPRFAILPFARLLDLPTEGEPSSEGRAYVVHLAVLGESTGAHEWQSEWRRFTLERDISLTHDGAPLIASISY